MSVRLLLIRLRDMGIENPRVEFSVGLGDAFKIWIKGERAGQRFDLTNHLSVTDIDFDLDGLAKEFLKGVFG